MAAVSGRRSSRSAATGEYSIRVDTSAHQTVKLCHATPRPIYVANAAPEVRDKPNIICLGRFQGVFVERKPISSTAKAPAELFTGDIYFSPVYKSKAPSRTRIALVRFTPGARTNWHSHAVGQTLHITEGLGVVANRDGTVFVVGPGETVYTPPGEEHWHGATEHHFMCHLAMLEGTAEGDGTTWLEPVNDSQYLAAHHKIT